LSVSGVSGEPGVASTGVGVGVGLRTVGWATTPAGARRGFGARATGWAGGGSTDGDGSTTGDGSMDGEPVGVSGVGSAVGALVGPGEPGVELPGSPDDEVVGSGALAVAVGAGETNAIPGVGPPAVVGGDWKSTIPTARTTPASTRLMTPRVRTSRSR
jgi:hypothetical protein